METKPKTQKVAFNAEDVEGFKELFPEFKSGNMTGRELGRKLVEILRNQTPYSEAPSIQNNDDLERLPQNHCKQLREQLAETEPSSDSDLQSSKQKLKIRLKHYFWSSKTKTTMNFYLTIKKTEKNGNKNTSI